MVSFSADKTRAFINKSVKDDDPFALIVGFFAYPMIPFVILKDSFIAIAKHLTEGK